MWKTHNIRNDTHVHYTYHGELLGGDVSRSSSLLYVLMIYAYSSVNSVALLLCLTAHRQVFGLVSRQQACHMNAGGHMSLFVPQ